eukprot:UC1_evm3s1668
MFRVVLGARFSTLLPARSTLSLNNTTSPLPRGLSIFSWGLKQYPTPPTTPLSKTLRPSIFNNNNTKEFPSLIASSSPKGAVTHSAHLIPKRPIFSRTPTSVTTINNPAFATFVSASTATASADTMDVTARTGAELLARVQSQLTSAGCSDALVMWDLTPAEIGDLADAYIAHAKGVYDAAAAAGRSATPSWQNVCEPMCRIDILASIVDSCCTFPQHVSANKSTRDASTAAEQKLSAFNVETASRVDVFHALNAVQATSDSEGGESFEGERARFLERNIREGKRKGLHLDDETRKKVLAINKQLSSLGIEYAKNLGEENTKLHFTKEELTGVPEDLLSTLDQTEDGKYTLTLKYPHYIPTMKLCEVDDTRRKCEAAFNSRCLADNTRILEELVKLRHEKAQLLGYATHAEFMLETRMAKTP